ncbi:unnamed protein product [Staurois parvus]|uniref:Uncharacterized protein n=1 Tax=Staurois parvus TaxID=386267 RepID=A0ABN9CEJ0_9NEOB|nr:unnamed protein product [Staurois parvus]
MIGVPLGPEHTEGTRSRCCALPGSAHKQGAGRPFINGHTPLHCSRSAVYIHGPDGK